MKFMPPTLEFVNGRLDAMLTHPLNWGGAEAFELQVLLLLELREFLRNPNSPSSHLERYSAFLRASHSDLGPRPLSAVSDDIETIAQLLGQFRESLDSSHPSETQTK